ncbi:unnamed protein product [Prunus armeniaca]
MLGGDEKLGRPAGVLHLDDSHPDIFSAFEDFTSIFGFGVSNLGFKYGYPNNLSVIIFIMKRVAKVGNEEEPKMAMNRFGHVRMIHFQSNTNNIFVNHHLHLLINYFPAQQTNPMIHHRIFSFTIPTAITLVQHPPIPWPSASNCSSSVSMAGPFMRAIGPLRLAHSHSRHSWAFSCLHPPPGPSCSPCWLSPPNWCLLCLNSFLCFPTAAV